MSVYCIWIFFWGWWVSYHVILKTVSTNSWRLHHGWCVLCDIDENRYGLVDDNRVGDIVCQYDGLILMIWLVEWNMQCDEPSFLVIMQVQPGTKHHENRSSRRLLVCLLTLLTTSFTSNLTYNLTWWVGWFVPSNLLPPASSFLPLFKKSWSFLFKLQGKLQIYYLTHPWKSTSRSSFVSRFRFWISSSISLSLSFELTT